MHFKKNIQYRMQLDNVYKLFAYVEKVPWIQTFWFVILVMSLVLSLCLTCCSNTDIRCCCFCCNVFSRLLCLARRRKRGEKHNQLRCKICRKSTSSVGVRLGALQNKEVFCWIISEWFIRIIKTNTLQFKTSNTMYNQKWNNEINDLKFIVCIDKKVFMKNPK